jgi:uncharacterized protein
MEVNCGVKATQTDATTLLQVRPAATMMAYKPSRFNAHTTTEHGVLILYNSYTGHTCAFPPRTAQRVRPLLSRSGVGGPITRIATYMIDNGFLVPKTVDEDARWDVRYGQQQYRTDVLQLILLASEDCNFRCVYCSQEFKRGSMLPEVRTGIRNLIMSRIAKLRGLQIGWFGGEPLLAFDVIEELAPFAQHVAKDHGVVFTSDITTNGYLLTPERSRKMVEWGITAYQITIDGTALDHDAHRPLKEGGPTFQQIVDNIVAMRRYSASFSVHLRVNFDRTNVNNLLPLFEVLKEQLGDDPRFQMRFRPVGKWGGPNDDQLSVCGLVEANRLITQLSDQAASIGLRTEGAADSVSPVESVCYAARPYNFVIGSDGKLMKCTVLLDTEPANVVGSISSDGKLNLDEDAFAQWVKPYYHTDTMCRKCFFVPVCQGMLCPVPRLLKGERPCPPHKLAIKDTLSTLWKDKERAHEGKLVRISAG